MQVNRGHFQEMKDLTTSILPGGNKPDVDLAKCKATFNALMGRDTTLDDDGVIAAYAVCSEEDEPDDAELAAVMLKIEKEGYQLTDAN